MILLLQPCSSDSKNTFKPQCSSLSTRGSIFPYPLEKNSLLCQYRGCNLYIMQTQLHNCNLDAESNFQKDIQTSEFISKLKGLHTIHNLDG